ncbi:MAG TPA: C4-type zinc ribbon domain-containing protein [Thermoanaerobaculia bacterium]|nr:C4-type zinc ribbon domain-containing protein [Thermoanaerobaculia bacterium]
MTQVVDQLWELQSVLSQLAEKERLLSVKPESFAEIDDDFQKGEAMLASSAQKIDQLAAERRAIERELQDNQELLKKYQGQLMQVKNQQQYAAAWKEIDVARKLVKEREDSLLASMGEIEDVKARIETDKAPHEELKARHTESYNAWQASLGELRAEVEKLRGQASVMEERIPPGPLNQFKRILVQRQGLAMARVINQSCGVCRVRIRPQANQQIKRGETVTCESCKRILYLERLAS